jgi:GNAT superfamily N-acetyltransferase
MEALIRRIEETALNSWPALQQVQYDGWILRFARGYTKRANSVNPLYDSMISIGEKIEACEKIYTGQNLRTIFRLTPFAPPELDRALEEQAYEKIDLTLVMHLDLDGLQAEKPAGLSEETLDDWMAAFCEFRGAPLAEHETHKEMLEAILSTRFLASLEDGGKTMACGLGVLENEYLGLFDLITDPRQRNRGYGTRLVEGLLAWAQENGALHAYLQVVSANAPARRLYARLGFQELYRYWYRIKDLR